MRDAIARALTWVLSLLPWTRRPEPGRHSAAFLADQAEPAPAHESPWSRPWTGPTKEEAQALFRAEATMPIAPVQREHHGHARLPRSERTRQEGEPHGIDERERIRLRQVATAFAEMGLDWDGYTPAGVHAAVCA